MGSPNVRPPVLPLPIDWRRDSLEVSYQATFEVERVDGPSYRFAAKVVFDVRLACWHGYVVLDGELVYQSEHRERDEACGACVVAMQRALDVRHPT